MARLYGRQCPRKESVSLAEGHASTILLFDKIVAVFLAVGVIDERYQYSCMQELKSCISDVPPIFRCFVCGATYPITVNPSTNNTRSDN
jgi:hypothetical protein